MRPQCIHSLKDTVEIQKWLILLELKYRDRTRAETVLGSQIEVKSVSDPLFQDSNRSQHAQAIVGV